MLHVCPQKPTSDVRAFFSFLPPPPCAHMKCHIVIVCQFGLILISRCIWVPSFLHWVFGRVGIWVQRWKRQQKTPSFYWILGVVGLSGNIVSTVCPEKSVTLQSTNFWKYTNKFWNFFNCTDTPVLILIGLNTCEFYVNSIIHHCTTSKVLVYFHFSEIRVTLFSGHRPTV